MSGAQTADAFPALARRYDTPCVTCHVNGAKLNEFGREFWLKGPRAMGMEVAKDELPITVYGSILGQTTGPNDEFRLFPRRLFLVALPLHTKSSGIYAEWYLFSQDLQPNGSLRDRSGRFEDLYGWQDLGPNLRLQVGQFRPLSQLDATQRLEISESVALRDPGGHVSRGKALESFAFSARSPAARLTTTGDFGISLTVPFPGELSLPLTRSARRHASAELKLEPKGAVLEVFSRDSRGSFGIGGFLGSDRPGQVGAFASRDLGGTFYFDAALVEHVGRGTLASLNFMWAPQWRRAFGARLDSQGGELTLVPYASLHTLANDTTTTRLVLEARFRSGTARSIAIERNVLK